MTILVGWQNNKIDDFTFPEVCQRSNEVIEMFLRFMNMCDMLFKNKHYVNSNVNLLNQ